MAIIARPANTLTKRTRQDELQAAIARDRNVGGVVFDIRSIPLNPPPKLPRWMRGLPDEYPTIVDKYVTCFGFARLGDRWRTIGREQAMELLSQVLERDMAYNDEIMSKQDARGYATKFLNLFSDECRCITNGEFSGTVLQHGWSPVQGATFDTGVICLDRDKIGMLWFGDED